MTILLMQVNLDHSIDDAAGWVTVGAYKQYPSRDEGADKLQEHLSRTVKEPICDVHYRYITVPFYENYV